MTDGYLGHLIYTGLSFGTGGNLARETVPLDSELAHTTLNSWVSSTTSSHPDRPLSLPPFVSLGPMPDEMDEAGLYGAWIGPTRQDARTPGSR